jgi:hypothetical protein
LAALNGNWLFFSNLAGKKKNCREIFFKNFQNGYQSTIQTRGDQEHSGNIRIF